MKIESVPLQMMWNTMLIRSIITCKFSRAALPNCECKHIFLTQNATDNENVNRIEINGN